MRTAPEELDFLTNSTDWASLVDMALDDPPNPRPLFSASFSWNTKFKIVNGRESNLADMPPALRYFLNRLAYAEYPPELYKWIILFEKKQGKKPSKSDIPAELKHLLPKEKSGRPRSDTRRWLAARRAWLAAHLKYSYERRRDTIANIGKHLESCFGYTNVDICGDRPSILALDKLSDETGLSPERIQDLLGHRKH